MARKKIKSLVSLLLIWSIVLSIFPQTNLKAENNIRGNKDFLISLERAEDSLGNQINESNPLDIYDDLFLYYKWNLKDGHSYKEDSVVEFYLPDTIRIKKQLTGELSQGKEVYGKYIIYTSGKVEFTFTKLVEEKSQIEGDFWFASELNLEKIVLEEKEVIIKDFELDKEIKLPLDISQIKIDFTKSGLAKPAFNPKEIEWKIKLNPNKIQHKNVLIEDIIPQGLTYQEDSFAK